MRIAWPPKATPALRAKDNARQKRDGEPSVVKLERWANDRSLRGDSQIECCDCGLIHLNTYEIVRAEGDFYLIRRAYRVIDARPKPKRKDRRRKK